VAGLGTHVEEHLRQGLQLLHLECARVLTSSQDEQGRELKRALDSSATSYSGRPFLPRGLGALMALSGLSWLTFLSPPFANGLLTPIEGGVGILAEGALMPWLLVMGVNGQRWEEQAGAAGITRTNPIEALSAQ
jgi:hypothetical protein